MKILETAKFSRLRKKIREAHEQAALMAAMLAIADDPAAGKFLKGEFKELRSFRYTVKGQSRRLIYKVEEDAVVLFSFGPRDGAYKR
jgi:mRNA-degrading endonuclease RelE of RelBE toxin-antitoxin system